MSDELLDLLANDFIEKQLCKKGWTFLEYVEEFQRGYITIQ